MAGGAVPAAEAVGAGELVRKIMPGQRTRLVFGHPQGSCSSGVYLCFVDESGTHGTSSVLVVSGIILHEEGTWHLQ